MTDIADAVLAALDARRQISPISDNNKDFGLEEAYDVADRVIGMRIARGEQPAGWKIGFTNRTIWDEYGVHAPIWGPMYREGIHARAPDAETLELDAGGFIEPRIEPEIIFRIARPPRAGMDDAELLSCIDAVSHGFEIVQSIYPGWKFSAADTVAAFALHGALVHGPMVAIDHDRSAEWIARLSSFELTLFRNGEEVDRGKAESVLDGPLSALRHFVEGLEARPLGRRVDVGDLVTTGTVTRAFPVSNGETWSTELHGLPLPGTRLRFGDGIEQTLLRLTEQAAQARFRMENPEACESPEEHQQAMMASVAAETAISRLLLRDRDRLDGALQTVADRADALAAAWKSSSNP